MELAAINANHVIKIAQLLTCKMCYKVYIYRLLDLIIYRMN